RRLGCPPATLGGQRDLPRLRLRRLRDGEREDAVLHVGANLVRIDVVGQRERASERAEGTLAAVIGLPLLVASRLLLFAFAADGQPVAADADFDVVFPEARHVRADGETVLLFADIEARNE